MRCALFAVCLGGCRSVELRLHADVPDGTTAMASLAFAHHTMAESSTACFEQSICRMTVGPSDVDGEDGVLLTAWADPEDDDFDQMRDDGSPPVPVGDEPRAEAVVDLPFAGTFEITLHLE